jgi:exopolyphosphatase / guanosine-5'-triphosphate,3'-diphosphate pyrophosphatase
MSIKRRSSEAQSSITTLPPSSMLDISVQLNPALEGQSFAAVDLGSNSFHMIVSRYSGGTLQLVDRIREPVRLAQGLSEDGSLSAQARERALSCLAQFGQRLRGLSPERVRTVATNTVRQLKNPRAFLMLAETALGSPIEIISGREEGRLTYLGVANTFAESRKRRLVVDIGGGSTEFILGQGFDVHEAESVQMGCVSSTKRFFADGSITRKQWREVQQTLASEIAPFRGRYLERGWKRVIGCSGTLKATAAVLHALGGPAWVITRAGLDDLIERVIQAGSVEKAKLPGLSADRRLVYAGGLAVIDACFRELNIDSMDVCEAALREGLLFDMLGRLSHTDPRADAVRGLARRHSIDMAHAKRVKQTALKLFDQVAKACKFDDIDRECLQFASVLHEIGLSISHSQHHAHGAYILANCDLTGFTKDEQLMLSLLVRAHRRSVAKGIFDALPTRDQHRGRILSALLRLSALIHRARSAEVLPAIKLSVNDEHFKLKFPTEWLAAHPLTRADLRAERESIEALGVKLTIVNVTHSGK